MKTLNHHQRYLLEEFVEAYLARAMPRRELIRRSLLATGSIALTASALFALGCGSDDEDGEDGPGAQQTAPPATPTSSTQPSQSASPDAPATQAASTGPAAATA